MEKGSKNWLLRVDLVNCCILKSCWSSYSDHWH